MQVLLLLLLLGCKRRSTWVISVSFGHSLISVVGSLSHGWERGGCDEGSILDDIGSSYFFFVEITMSNGRSVEE